jgi:hypothetical protein
MEADGLSDTPLDSIAHNGLTDRARQGETDVRTRRLCFADAERREEGAGDADPMVINTSKIL